MKFGVNEAVQDVNDGMVAGLVISVFRDVILEDMYGKKGAKLFIKTLRQMVLEK